MAGTFRMPLDKRQNSQRKVGLWTGRSASARALCKKQDFQLARHWTELLTRAQDKGHDTAINPRGAGGS